MSFRFDIPPFEPHPLLRNRHAQTLAGTYLRARAFPYQAERHQVELPDGDSIVLHDDWPTRWKSGERIVLLLHGLAGCYLSSYMVRVAGKLHEAGIRTFRMDLRGCGAGQGLAKHPYHAGRSDDARRALQFLARLCPDSPATVVGFSLSGNIVLKLLGEEPEALPQNVEKAAAVSPALDLLTCCKSLVGPFQRVYDRHFVRLLCQQIEENRGLRPDIVPLDKSRRLRTLFEFDDVYTGPVCGFGSAENYYATNSAGRHVSQIGVPTLILAAEDDPLVPGRCFNAIEPSSHVLLHVTKHGGHLGYVGKRGCDPDRRWMDWRIVDWVRTDVRRIDQVTSSPGSVPVNRIATPEMRI